MFSMYDEIVSVDDVCEMLHLGKNSVYRLLAQNKIHSIKIGKKYLIPKQSVIYFISDKTKV